MNDQTQYPRRGDVNMRDEFAMAALDAVMRLPWPAFRGEADAAAWIAVQAYRVADAMLSQREIPLSSETTNPNG